MDSDLNLDIGLGPTRDNLNGSRNHPRLDESLVDVVTDRKTRMSRYGERFPPRDKGEAASRLRRTERRSRTGVNWSAMRLGWPYPALPPGYSPDLAHVWRRNVAPPDVMAIGGHAGCRHHAEVPQAENPNIHRVTSSDSLAQGP